MRVNLDMPILIFVIKVVKIIMIVPSQESNSKSEINNCISTETERVSTKCGIKFENAYQYFCCRVVLAPSADTIRLLLNKKKFYVKHVHQSSNN